MSIRMSNEDRKRQIKERAGELFVKQGFQRTSMQDIVTATKLSRGGVYYHYDSTLDILYDLMLEGQHYRMDIMKEYAKAHSDGSTMDVLVDGITEKILADNQWIPLYVIFLQEKKDNPKLEKLFLKLKCTALEDLRKYLRQDTEVSSFLQNFDFLTDFINSFILGSEILGARERFTENRDLIKKMVRLSLKHTKSSQVSDC